MAINRGVLGSQTGSMGGITASNWKGRNVYKQKVPATNSSNTPAQQVQRRKFAVLARLSGMYGSAIRIGYKSAAAKVTEQNAFVANNYASVYDDGTKSQVDITAIKMAQGTLLPPENLAAVGNDATRELTFTYRDNSNGYDALPTDRLVVCLFDNDMLNSAVLQPALGTRSAGTVKVVVPVGFEPSITQSRAFFMRPGTSSTSPDVLAEQ